MLNTPESGLQCVLKAPPVWEAFTALRAEGSAAWSFNVLQQLSGRSDAVASDRLHTPNQNTSIVVLGETIQRPPAY